MARGYLLVPVALLLVGAPSILPMDAPDARRVDVNITANCAGNSVSVTVAPWEVRVARTDSVMWSFSGADSMDIVPLNRGGRAWPFQRGNPGRARANGRASSGPTQGNAQANVPYSYQIVLYCGARQVIIDPEVIIEDEE